MTKTDTLDRLMERLQEVADAAIAARTEGRVSRPPMPLVFDYSLPDASTDVQRNGVRLPVGRVVAWCEAFPR